MEKSHNNDSQALTAVSIGGKLGQELKPSLCTKANQADAVLTDGRDEDFRRNRGRQFPTTQLERFVDADVIAEFLSVKRKTILDWARAGIIPAHPYGRGRRVVWRFRISEIASHQKPVWSTMKNGSPGVARLEKQYG